MRFRRMGGDAGAKRAAQTESPDSLIYYTARASFFLAMLGPARIFRGRDRFRAGPGASGVEAAGGAGADVAGEVAGEILVDACDALDCCADGPQDGLAGALDLRCVADAVVAESGGEGLDLLLEGGGCLLYTSPSPRD